MLLLGICSSFSHNGVFSSLFKGELLGIKKQKCVYNIFILHNWEEFRQNIYFVPMPLLCHHQNKLPLEGAFL
jgi:hypothetical protein